MTEWIAPMEAARRISERVGHIITPDDLKQMRNTGRIKNVQEVTRQVKLYDADEIATLEPPNKRVRLAVSWDEFLRNEQAKRKRKYENRRRNVA